MSRDHNIPGHCTARVLRALRDLRALTDRRGLPALPVVGAIMLVLVALMLSGIEPALAQDASGAGGTVDAAIDRMETTLANLGNNLGEAARTLLLILFTVDLVLRFGRWAMEESSFGQVFGSWLFQLAFVAMVYVLALMVPQVVDQLTGLAQRFASLAGNAEEPSASGMITGGLQHATNWIAAIKYFDPSTWLYIFAALISVIVTAMTVAFLVIAYAEIYLVGLAGIIVLGLAGLQETRGAAIAYIRMLIGKALKLMALMIVYGALHTLTSALSVDSAGGAGVSAALGMIMLQIIGALLIISLPSTVEGLVSNIGSSVAESGARTVGGVAQTGVSTAGGFALGFMARNLGPDIARKLGGLLGMGAKEAADVAGKAAKTAAGVAGETSGLGAAKGLMQATDAITPDAANELRDRIQSKIRGK